MPFDIQLLPRIDAKSLREDGKQYYVDAQGNRFPSVTTILNATKIQADHDRLLNWKARVGTEEASRITTAASRRGTKHTSKLNAIFSVKILLHQKPVFLIGKVSSLFYKKSTQLDSLKALFSTMI